MTSLADLSDTVGEFFVEKLVSGELVMRVSDNVLLSSGMLYAMTLDDNTVFHHRRGWWYSSIPEIALSDTEMNARLFSGETNPVQITIRWNIDDIVDIVPSRLATLFGSNDDIEIIKLIASEDAIDEITSDTEPVLIVKDMSGIRDLSDLDDSDIHYEILYVSGKLPMILDM